MAIISGRNAAAKALNIAPATLREWMEQPGFPHHPKGHDINAIRAWVAERGKKGSEGASTLGRIKVAREGQRLKQDVLKTQKMQIQLQQLEGSVLWRRAAELVISTLLTETADDLVQLGQTFPGTCGVPAKYQAAIRKRLKEELDSFRERVVDRCHAATKSLDDQAAEAAAVKE